MCGSIFRIAISAQMLQINFYNTFCEIALRLMLQNTSDDKSTLVQVMAWYHQSITWANVDPDLYHHMESITWANVDPDLYHHMESVGYQNQTTAAHGSDGLIIQTTYSVGHQIDGSMIKTHYNIVNILESCNFGMDPSEKCICYVKVANKSSGDNGYFKTNMYSAMGSNDQTPLSKHTACNELKQKRIKINKLTK